MQCSALQGKFAVRKVCTAGMSRARRREANGLRLLFLVQRARVTCLSNVNFLQKAHLIRNYLQNNIANHFS